jgi:hypothetical protein
MVQVLGRMLTITGPNLKPLSAVSANLSQRTIQLHRHGIVARIESERAIKRRIEAEDRRLAFN